MNWHRPHPGELARPWRWCVLGLAVLGCSGDTRTGRPTVSVEPEPIAIASVPPPLLEPIENDASSTEKPDVPAPAKAIASKPPEPAEPAEPGDSAEAISLVGAADLRPERRPPPKLLDQAAMPIGVKEPADMKFVLIKSGKFTMGSTEEQINAAAEAWGDEVELMKDELPAHTVQITRSFEILATEVTQQQYESVMRQNPSTTYLGPNLPVNSVLFEDAVEFCRRLSMATGRNYRLPTEAEWEYACRSGSTGHWCFGDDMERLIEYCQYDESSPPGIVPVARHRPNVWGLYDMHGNVWEYCSDFYGPFASGAAVDPKGPENGPGRVVKGGAGVGAFGSKTRSAERDFDRGMGMVNLGFRVVRDAEE